MVSLSFHFESEMNGISSVLCIVLLSAFASAGKTNLRSSSSESSFAVEILRAHNKERALVGVPPLSWDAKVASFASKYGRVQRNQHHCEMVHSETKIYGENLCWGVWNIMTPAEAVQAWIALKKFYDYNTNSCYSDEPCGVYTQVVWEKSTKLGCAEVSCDKGNATLVVCNYFPRGNIIGERPF